VNQAPLGLRVFLNLFGLIGLIAIGFGGWTLFQSLRCEHWPVTDARILTATISVNHGKSTTYSPNVDYTYTVAGQTYESKRIAYGQMSSSSDYARRVLSRYSVGATVPTHYNPADPTQAVLEPGVHGGFWICLIVGTIFILFSRMFLQITKKAAANPGMVRDGAIRTDRPPPLFGVIFMIAGVSIFIAVLNTSTTPNWPALGAASMFAFAGLGIFLWSLGVEGIGKFFGWIAGVLFMGVFNFVSFGHYFPALHAPAISQPFPIFTGFFDLVFLLIFFKWVYDRTRV